MFQDYIELLSYSLPNEYFTEDPQDGHPNSSVPDFIRQERINDRISWPFFKGDEHALAVTLRRRSLPLIKLQPQAVEPESSGWMVLHAMRRTLAGQPVVDFSDLTASVREIALSHFKCEILAATRARTLKPTEEDFANLIHDVHRTEFFDNAMYAIDGMFSTDHSHNSPNVIEPASGHMVDNTLLVAQDASEDRHGGLAVQNVSEILQDSSLSCSSQDSPEILS
ncbi:uncharacterized protein PpBr36_11239, partial [Pyricularia pennisetigena]|uniref:uncharacterized protein n=1 Tax=Pyricularia pennisetigena TaxID=1578925 RepID=UPI0011539F32